MDITKVPATATKGVAVPRLFSLYWEFTLLVLFSTFIMLLSVQFDLLSPLKQPMLALELAYPGELLVGSAVLFTGAFAILFRRHLLLQRQVRDNQRNEARLARATMRDSLTGLVNRALFMELLDKELAKARRDNYQVAIFFLGLDQFKQTNDVFGYRVGDELLCKVARRLEACVRQMDTVARLGGDEFAIIQPRVNQAGLANMLAGRIIDAVQKPGLIDQHQLPVGISIGVAQSQHQSMDGHELMRRGAVAMNRAKEEGGHTIRFFDEQMDEQLRNRDLLEKDLREAVANNELFLHYQPQFNLSDDGLTGFEALMRWQHPERGLVPPNEFIPVAEEMGIINQFEEWSVRQACEVAARWPEDISMAVNISAKHLQSLGFASYVRRTLNDTGLSPARLELEVTESMLMHNTKLAMNTITELKKLGVRIALDDFGTGYSSLSYLRQFPFDKLKIDRSFVMEMERKPEDITIIRAMIQMSQSLGMETLAEGIENSEQLVTLAQTGCKKVQGFLTGRPMAIDDANELVSKR